MSAAERYRIVKRFDEQSGIMYALRVVGADDVERELTCRKKIENIESIRRFISKHELHSDALVMLWALELALNFARMIASSNVPMGEEGYATKSLMALWAENIVKEVNSTLAFVGIPEDEIRASDGASQNV
jgi:hypothetical protein